MVVCCCYATQPKWRTLSKLLSKVIVPVWASLGRTKGRDVITVGTDPRCTHLVIWHSEEDNVAVVPVAEGLWL